MILDRVAAGLGGGGDFGYGDAAAFSGELEDRDGEFRGDRPE